MYAVLEVSKANETPKTRLVFGCMEPAETTANFLMKCGYEVEAGTYPIAPDRPADEKDRAANLMDLIYATSGGHA